MLVQGSLAGNWRGSSYSSSGERLDIELLLGSDGTFRRQLSREDGWSRADRGHWEHQEAGAVLQLLSEPSSEEAGGLTLWQVLAVNTCEGSNALLVLRQVALGGRRLPILFYRVHLPAEAQGGR